MKRVGHVRRHSNEEKRKKKKKERDEIVGVFIVDKEGEKDR